MVILVINKKQVTKSYLSKKMKKIISKLVLKTIGFYFNVLEKFSSSRAAKTSLNLFCTPQKGKVLPFQKDFLEKAKKETIQAEKHNLQVYQWKGTKETILLLHGWESNVFRWRNLINFLTKEDFNVIAFDAPAHGNSDGSKLHVPLYTACLNNVIKKYNPKHIIGHSVGGMTTMYNEYLYKNKNVEKLIILGAPSDLIPILNNYQQLLGFNTKVRKALKQYFMGKFGFEPEYFSIADFVKYNTKQGLVIHDEFDKIAPCNDSERVHKNWKNSTFVKTQGLGHSLHQEDVNKQIIDFLKSA